jgi:hypothetical protein
MGIDRSKDFADSDALCRAMKAEAGPRVALAFSRGKDAIATWIQLKRHGFEVFPYYRVVLPGYLRIERESLAYFEQVLGTKIHRFLSPQTIKLFNASIFQPPRHAKEAVTFPEWTSDEQAAALLRENGWDGDTWETIGIRASDNLVRSTTIKRHGPINRKRKTWFPIYDWSNDRTFTEVRDSGIKLPPDYHLWGRSLDGFHHRFIAELCKDYPDDLERIRAVFPLIDVEFWRLEFRDRFWRKHGD